MRPLFVEATNHTPLVHLNTNGELLIEGKSLPEDTAKFYDPLFTWISECSLETIKFTIKMEYMNSSSANQITKLLFMVKDNPYIKECVIDWHYETNDEDNYDFGKELETVTEYKFNFFEFAEA
jgi:hypothetical protein